MEYWSNPSGVDFYATYSKLAQLGMRPTQVVISAGHVEEVVYTVEAAGTQAAVRYEVEPDAVGWAPHPTNSGPFDTALRIALEELTDVAGDEVWDVYAYFDHHFSPETTGAFPIEPPEKHCSSRRRGELLLLFYRETYVPDDQHHAALCDLLGDLLHLVGTEAFDAALCAARVQSSQEDALSLLTAPVSDEEPAT